MPQLIQSILDQVRPTTLIDIGITALLIYWLFSLIRGTRAVRLVIGVSVYDAGFSSGLTGYTQEITQVGQAMRLGWSWSVRRRVAEAQLSR